MCRIYVRPDLLSTLPAHLRLQFEPHLYDKVRSTFMYGAAVIDTAPLGDVAAAAVTHSWSYKGRESPDCLLRLISLGNCQLLLFGLVFVALCLLLCVVNRLLPH